MRLFRCCCGWSWVIGRRKAYGPIWPMGIGAFPDALSPGQRMMSQEQFRDEYGDCAACASGQHSHRAESRARHS